MYWLERLGERMDGVGSEAGGESVARLLRYWLPEVAVTLPAGATYLAIGAGQAKPEIAFAKKLGLPDHQVTLLDIRFTAQAIKRFKDMEFSGIVMEEDVYSFLEKPDAGPFDIVSAFGMDYALDTFEKHEQLIAAISRKMNPNGVVYLGPSGVDTDITPLWTTHGYIPLGKSSEHLPRQYAMLFRPPNTKP